MIFGSVCSGIEGASLAWEPLGWRAAFFAETDPFASAVLAHRWPHVPNLGDFTRIGVDVAHEPIDILVGGTPCQSFSIAGQRAGLDDPRGNLTLEFLALAGRVLPRWILWENVPGVLSIDGGRTFGAFLGALGKLGYGFAYRVLDAQYFGVPQRRRRVFVVGHFGAWQCAAAVLFEPSCLRRDPPPRREAREDVAGTLAPGAHPGSYNGRDAENGSLLPATAVTARAMKGPDSECTTTLVVHSLRADGFDASEDGTGRGTPLVAFDCKASGRNGVHVGEQSPTLRAMGHRSGNQNAGGQVAVFNETQITSRENRCQPKPGDPSHPLASGARPPTIALPIQDATHTNRKQNGTGIGDEGDPAYTVQAAAMGAVAHNSSIRRLTPLECERLQGVPDGHTAIPRAKKTAADGPRYRALGNGFAVPVVRWIGERIAIVDAALGAL